MTVLNKQHEHASGVGAARSGRGYTVNLIMIILKPGETVVALEDDEKTKKRTARILRRTLEPLTLSLDEVLVLRMKMLKVKQVSLSSQALDHSEDVSALASTSDKSKVSASPPTSAVDTRT